MQLTNRTAQLILLLILFGYIAGFFIVKDWSSYLIGSGIMYVMCSIVLNKYKMELKEMQLKVI